jgi:hypothetical protein
LPCRITNLALKKEIVWANSKERKNKVTSGTLFASSLSQRSFRKIDLSRFGSNSMRLQELPRERTSPSTQEAPVQELVSVGQFEKRSCYFRKREMRKRREHNLENEIRQPVSRFVPNLSLQQAANNNYGGFFQLISVCCGSFDGMLWRKKKKKEKFEQ